MHIASEKTMRVWTKEIVGDEVHAERVPLTFKPKDGTGEEVKLTPFGYVIDLWAKIVKILDENER